MALSRLPALFMRGGTSKGLVFDVRDLPADQDKRDRIFLSAMGSPDPNGRQLDGMGGGLSSLSKVCIVGPSSRDDADIDYTFAQISVGDMQVDYAGNCGNMASAVGPAALELGIVEARGGEARLRVHNTNTARIIEARFPVEDGLLASNGDLAIDGVAGTGAPIRLDFLDPGGSKTGRLLPTGNPVDDLRLPDCSTIKASLVDSANPCVYVSAADLGKSGNEHPEDLAADAAFQSRMEHIRLAASVRMGLTPDLAAAAQMPSIPKVAVVAPPGEVTLLDGSRLGKTDMDILVRMISMGQPHRAIPMTGAICLAAACRIEGAIPALAVQSEGQALRLGHPSGTTMVDADVAGTGEGTEIASATLFRTARLLFSGTVHFRD